MNDITKKESSGKGGGTVRKSKKTPLAVDKEQTRRNVGDCQNEDGCDGGCGDGSGVSLREAEDQARSKAIKNPFILFILNGFSAFYVFAAYLISLESIFGMFLSVGATIWVYNVTTDQPGWDGTMDWVLLSFAVVTPMSVSIGISFRRRENALRDIAIFRSNSYQLYLAHACWDWGTSDPGGRAKRHPDPEFWLDHADRALSELVGIGDELCRFLTLPSYSRARHRVTRVGRREAARTAGVAYRLFDSLLTTRMAKFTSLTEVLKRCGLPPNEASRIRQWERLMGEAVEDLRMIKVYRTPQALRSFARLFTVFLPPFYAPTFAQLSHDLNSLGVGITFAIITSLALTALFESIYILEDPFVAHLCLDGIDVHEELQVLHYHQLMKARSIFFPSAPKYEEPVSVKSDGKEKTDGGDGDDNDDDGGIVRSSSYARFRAPSENEASGLRRPLSVGRDDEEGGVDSSAHHACGKQKYGSFPE